LERTARESLVVIVFEVMLIGIIPEQEVCLNPVNGYITIMLSITQRTITSVVIVQYPFCTDVVPSLRYCPIATSSYYKGNIMIPTATRLDIIADRFAYIPGEIITVDASQLCEEIISHDKLKYKVAHLEARIDLLMSLLTEKSSTPTYRYVDLKA
jgi:hypothetical protein